MSRLNSARETLVRAKLDPAWSMHRDGLRRGVVTLCIDGGQGIALALEKV